MCQPGKPSDIRSSLCSLAAALTKLGLTFDQLKDATLGSSQVGVFFEHLLNRRRDAEAPVEPEIAFHRPPGGRLIHRRPPGASPFGLGRGQGAEGPRGRGVEEKTGKMEQG